MRPANDAPILGGISGSIGYALNSAAIVLAPEATLSDPDSPEFQFGILEVKVTGGIDASNRLELGGRFSVKDNHVCFDGRWVGMRNSNGLGTASLRITFERNFYQFGVQALLRSIRFRTFDSTNTASRVIAFTISDGDGGLSKQVMRTVSVL